MRVNQKTSPPNILMFKPDGVRVEGVDSTSWWSSSATAGPILLGAGEALQDVVFKVARGNCRMVGMLTWSKGVLSLCPSWLPARAPRRIFHWASWSVPLGFLPYLDLGGELCIGAETTLFPLSLCLRLGSCTVRSVFLVFYLVVVVFSLYIAQ